MRDFARNRVLDLQKYYIKPWQKQIRGVLEANAEYVAYVEDILDQYELSNDPERPLVCYNEGLKKLIEETCQGTPSKSG